MATPTEMRALATTLEEIAPHVDTNYGPGQVATYGLAWEALRSAADEIERLRKAHEDVREQIHETRYAGLLHRTNAEGMCSEILRIIHEARGSDPAPGAPHG